jgi:hypothetical protein
VNANKPNNESILCNKGDLESLEISIKDILTKCSNEQRCRLEKAAENGQIVRDLKIYAKKALDMLAELAHIAESNDNCTNIKATQSRLAALIGVMNAGTSDLRVQESIRSIIARLDIGKTQNPPHQVPSNIVEKSDSTPDFKTKLAQAFQKKSKDHTAKVEIASENSAALNDMTAAQSFLALLADSSPAELAELSAAIENGHVGENSLGLS